MSQSDIEQIREALEIAVGATQELANAHRLSMGNYRQPRQKALDAEHDKCVSALAALDRLEAQESREGEPVAEYQVKMKGTSDPWLNVSEHSFNLLTDEYGFERRTLYTSKQALSATESIQVLTDAQLLLEFAVFIQRRPDIKASILQLLDAPKKRDGLKGGVAPCGADLPNTKGFFVADSAQEVAEALAPSNPIKQSGEQG